jgi:hypothetical protein
VAKYLRMLGRLNLVAREQHRSGFRLLIENLDLIANPEIVNKLQFKPVNVNKQRIFNPKKDHQLTAAVDQGEYTSYRSNPGYQEAFELLCSLGIGEPKRSSIAGLEYVTPQYIHAWHVYLEHLKGDAYRVGLLIHVLESGDPAPDVRKNGHPLNCTCRECKPLICPECHVYPCDCSP